MARNEVLHEGSRMSLPVPNGTPSGGPVLVFGTIPGVTQTREAEGGNPTGRATVWTGEGVFALPITDAVTTEGTAIYITAANALTTTATNNTLFGRTVHIDGTGGTKGSGAGTVNVRLARV